jgi:uncharacterized membrane protein YjfL (UPF0719 family)
MKENFMDIEEYGIYILYTFIYIICMIILKQILNLKATGHYDADTELASGNLAVGLRRTGAQLGLAIAMMGVLAGTTQGTLIDDLISSLTYGLIAVAFIVSSLVLTDKFILPGVNNIEALKERNVSVGIVEFGMLTATGIIAYSSIVGEGGGFISSIVYFLVGQLTLVMLVLVYEKLVMRNINIVETISNKNTSLGIYIGGKLIAYALILKSAISGNQTEMPINDKIIEFIVIAVMGMILLYVFEFIIDLFIVTSSKMLTIIKQDQIVPALQITVGKIGVALILSNAIL